MNIEIKYYKYGYNKDFNLFTNSLTCFQDVEKEEIKEDFEIKIKKENKYTDTCNQIPENKELVPILKSTSVESAECEVKVDYDNLEDRRSLKSFYDRFIYRTLTII